MNASDLFPPSEYLKSEDVEENGGEMQLTIKAVARKEYEEDDGSKTVKGILTFAEVEKKMTLNVTNTHVLITMYGDKNIDTAWPGKTVILYVDPNVKYAGKIVKGIRIRLIDEKQDLVTTFWKKARELGFTQQDGKDHLALFGGDFKAALTALVSGEPEPA
jgi:hypothetical protein